MPGFPLVAWQDLVAELEGLTIDWLPHQAAVPDEVTAVGLDDPQPKAVAGVTVRIVFHSGPALLV